MSGERPQAPRRPRPVEVSSSHARPAEPFQLADDVEDLPPEEVHEVPESEPPPTPLAQLRAEMRERFGAVHVAIHNSETRVRAEILQLRTDITGRVNTLDQRTLPQKVGGGALAVGKYSLYVTAAVAVLNALAKQWPWLADVAKALGSISL
jgi:hypothetical protein